jgi:hypothetical protein
LKKENLYIFVFSGEFGYELINWQGRIRKFIEMNPNIFVVVAGKSACEVLYRDFSHGYIPIDDCEMYKQSFADRYFAHKNGYNYRNIYSDFFDEIWAIKFRFRLKNFITQALNQEIIGNRKLNFIFSDVPKSIKGIKFGAPRTMFARLFNDVPQDIYLDVPILENSYRNILENLTSGENSAADLIRKSERPIAMIQTATRVRINRVTNELDEEKFLEEFALHWEVILLEYESSRTSDTQGVFNTYKFRKIMVKSLAEQLALLSKADICINFTHGDFRSNTYVPALAGFRSYVITDNLTLKNSSIQLWNKSVFDGEIIPIICESPDLAVLEIQRIQKS